MGVSLGIVTIACAHNLLKSNRVVVTLCTLVFAGAPWHYAVDCTNTSPCVQPDCSSHYTLACPVVSTIPSTITVRLSGSLIVLAA